jgi:hypothetical protein
VLARPRSQLDRRLPQRSPGDEIEFYRTDQLTPEDVEHLGFDSTGEYWWWNVTCWRDGAEAQPETLSSRPGCLCGVTFYRPRASGNTLLHSAIIDIGRARSKTAAQAMLRWHFQEGRSSIPKSTRLERIAENFPHLRL